MRFHITSLPHTQTTEEYCWCAYTSKVRRFCNMMTNLGHEVFLYGGTQNEARVKEFVTVVNDGERKKWFGHYDWNRDVFGGWNPQEPWWVTMNIRAIEKIQERADPGDFLGVIAGRCQGLIVEAFKNLRTVEWGIGYEGILDDAFHVFESYAWMHYLYGKYNVQDGKFFDTVIPNSFEVDEFEFNDKKDDYLLYLGRLTPRKGLEIVELLAKKYRIVTAGQGDIRIPGTEHIGVVRGDVKRKLLANAKAVLVPTIYIEPFGGVAVEAMLSGTPVITTDFGAFTETVIDGVTGYRCSTMADFHRAAEAVGSLYPPAIFNHASQYLTDAVGLKYDNYFKRLQTLDGNGWYSD